jgi:hypothetical protein
LHHHRNTPHLSRQHPTTNKRTFTMERTPSPPRRLRTPPGPLHGGEYEPYSPRRSTRVAAQRDIHLHQGSQQSARARRDITPTATSKRKATARMNNFTLSPPSSPITSPQRHSPRSMKRTQPEGSALDSESELAAPSTARRFKQMVRQYRLTRPAAAP